jgi:prolipoprotein diacylglyceryltransferase
MEKIAFIYGETFLYWGTLILTLAAVAAIALYTALYVKKGGSALALTAGVMLSAVIGIPLSRLIHWYCRAASYESLRVAMMDYSTGGYALMGVFIACLLAAVFLRVLRICDNLPRMLDCMAIGGGAGIAIGYVIEYTILFKAVGHVPQLPTDIIGHLII